MNAIHNTSGNRQRFEDFSSELESRKDIYDTIYRRALEAEKDEKAEAEKKLQEQRDFEQAQAEKQDQKRNLLITIAGVAFATPAWAEAFGLEFNWIVGFCTLAFAILLSVVVWQFLNKHPK